MGEKLLSEILNEHHEFGHLPGFDELRDMACELERKVAWAEAWVRNQLKAPEMASDTLWNSMGIEVRAAERAAERAIDGE